MPGTSPPNQPRYFVQVQRRTHNPMSSVSFYTVCEHGTDAAGRPFVQGIERFSVRVLGAAEALRRADALRDELNAAAKASA